MDFVVETVQNAGSNLCPPIIVGVGVGVLLAQRANQAECRRIPANRRNRQQREQPLPYRQD